MDLSRRATFCPCSRDSSGNKGQFCFISKESCNWDRPSYPHRNGKEILFQFSLANKTKLVFVA